MKPEPIKGQPLDAEDTFWLEQGQELLKGSIAAIENAGKQLITLLTTMQGIYLGAVAYSEFTKKLAHVPVWQHLVLIIPLLIWLCALYFALNIFRTQAYKIRLNAPGEIEAAFDRIAAAKQKFLSITYWLIVIGLLAAMFNIVIYFTMIA